MAVGKYCHLVTHKASVVTGRKIAPYTEYFRFPDYLTRRKNRTLPIFFLALSSFLCRQVTHNVFISCMTFSEISMGNWRKSAATTR